MFLLIVILLLVSIIITFPIYKFGRTKTARIIAVSLFVLLNLFFQPIFVEKEVKTFEYKYSNREPYKWVHKNTGRVLLEMCLNFNDISGFYRNIHEPWGEGSEAAFSVLGNRITPWFYGGRVEFNGLDFYGYYDIHEIMIIDTTTRKVAYTKEFEDVRYLSDKYFCCFYSTDYSNSSEKINLYDVYGEDIGTFTIPCCGTLKLEKGLLVVYFDDKKTSVFNQKGKTLVEDAESISIGVCDNYDKPYVLLFDGAAWCYIIDSKGHKYSVQPPYKVTEKRSGKNYLKRAEFMTYPDAEYSYEKGLIINDIAIGVFMDPEGNIYKKSSYSPYNYDTYSPNFYYDNPFNTPYVPSSPDPTPSHEPNYIQTSHDCTMCGGKGTIIDFDNSIPDFGTGNKWCGECGKSVPVQHIHKTCPSCHGRKIVTKWERR